MTYCENCNFRAAHHWCEVCFKQQLAQARAEGAREERERCAKIADNIAITLKEQSDIEGMEGDYDGSGVSHAMAICANRIAAAIREAAAGGGGGEEESGELRRMK
ncbi:MAG: hypothetical protein GTO55_07650 [Armatimonadetes bacterium]|nr:hypothetical protein [Armatimonadota bacterium]NIM24139.1 hypothetical protein [Armatimonadota bacterium]NIM67998.1 hypothetical protein [Armatimonadota bacterium]NIM76496.1 hypothetical protein [Armatimonadota bacterium]NIN06221.1 hypothetical protein [Armatimonadota bacterium]